VGSITIFVTESRLSQFWTRRIRATSCEFI